MKPTAEILVFAAIMLGWSGYWLFQWLRGLHLRRLEVDGQIRFWIGRLQPGSTSFSESVEMHRELQDLHAKAVTSKQRREICQLIVRLPTTIRKDSK